MSEYKKRADEVLLKRSSQNCRKEFRHQCTMTNEQLQEFIEHAMKVTDEDFVQRGKIHGE